MENTESQSTNALVGMFSDSAKARFARVQKPVEVKKPKAQITEPANDESGKEESKKKERKPKKNSKEAPNDDGEEATATETTPETADENADVDMDVDAAIDTSNNDRTLFVGNLSINLEAKDVTRIFSKYGKIESIRFRSVPVAGIKVDRAGDQNLVKKVCANINRLGDQKGSVNAYIVYKDAISVQAAFVENNSLVENRHIRVDTANPTLFDTQRSVFIGNLPYKIDEEELREHFSKVKS
jgi:nucleolar protein 12